MNKFKVGDKVCRVVDVDECHKATSGNVVTVKKVEYQERYNEWYLSFVEENNSKCEWLSDFYELVEPAQEPKSSDVVFITTAEYEGLRNRIAELEEALKIKEAWVLWDGAEECPVQGNTLVEVCYADRRHVYDKAGTFDWADSRVVNNNIIAYRIVK